MFALKDMHRAIVQLETDFKQDLDETSGVQLMQFKNENSSITKRFQKMSEKYESILQCPITNSDTLMRFYSVQLYISLSNVLHHHEGV